MNDNFFINKFLRFFLRPKHPKDSHNKSINFYSEEVEGKIYYFRLIPCLRYGMFPEIGTITLQEVEKIYLEKQKKYEQALIDYRSTIDSKIVSNRFDKNLTMN